MKQYFIYILTNFHNTTFYIGITNNLERRVLEHRNQESAFSKRYKLYKLIYYEEYSRIDDALKREKQLKNWHREWKINLIKSMNPILKNLWEDAETSSA